MFYYGNYPEILVLYWILENEARKVIINEPTGNGDGISGSPPQHHNIGYLISRLTTGTLEHLFNAILTLQDSW